MFGFISDKNYKRYKEIFFFEIKIFKKYFILIYTLKGFFAEIKNKLDFSYIFYDKDALEIEAFSILDLIDIFLLFVLIVDVNLVVCLVHSEKV